MDLRVSELGKLWFPLQIQSSKKAAEDAQKQNRKHYKKQSRGKNFWHPHSRAEFYNNSEFKFTTSSAFGITKTNAQYVLWNAAIVLLKVPGQSKSKLNFKYSCKKSKY